LTDEEIAEFEANKPAEIWEDFICNMTYLIDAQKELDEDYAQVKTSCGPDNFVSMDTDQLKLT
jgi:hypothetical protein